jgi:hypothetical protein
MAHPTREQIEAHGEDCRQRLTVAKGHQAPADTRTAKVAA